MFEVLVIAANILLFVANLNGCPIAERPCTTANGTQGYCILSRYCPRINRLIGNASSEELEFITQSICGYDIDKTRLFCCDIKELKRELPDENRNSNVSFSSSKSTLDISQNVVQAQTHTSPLNVGALPLPPADFCQTPNGERAHCVSIYQCPKILFILQNNTNGEQRRYLRESKCGMKNGVFLVCCGSDVTFRYFDEDKENWYLKPNALIPSNDCGHEIFSLPNRVFGGNNSEREEFPWVALLEYNVSPHNRRAFLCGGALITSRYVLTAAHCIVGQQVQTIVNVRLGEWNYNKERVECAVPNNPKSCVEPTVNAEVESLHPHPAHRERYNDIGLIRLQKEVRFTLFISPICLPNANSYLPPGERMIISGWGLKNFNEETSIKQKVDLPIIATSQCSVMFEKNTLLRRLGRGQFCAGGEAGKDACVGDSGTPLMRRYNSTANSPARWTIEGIVSFGLGCGVEDLYGVYTKVSKYIGWIHRTIVP